METVKEYLEKNHKWMGVTTRQRETFIKHDDVLIEFFNRSGMTKMEFIEKYRVAIDTYIVKMIERSMSTRRKNAILRNK